MVLHVWPSFVVRDRASLESTQPVFPATICAAKTVADAPAG
jgi:hypothetical protein